MKEESRDQGARFGGVRGALLGRGTVAVVRLGSIGDVIATLPVAWILRDVLGPDVRLVWIAHPGPARLLDGVKALDSVVRLPRASVLGAVSTWRGALRPLGIEAVVDLHGNLKSGLVALLTGAPVRVGLAREDCREPWNRLATNLRLPPLGTGNKTLRALELGRLLGHPSPAIRFGLEFTREENERAAAVLASLGKGAHSCTVLQVGRHDDVRAWPPERFAALARTLAGRGGRVVVIAGPDEIRAGNEMASLIGRAEPRIRLEVGTLSIREVGALLSALGREPGKRHAFVASDTGTLHLAVACGLRSIGLFGPQDPGRTAPVGDGIEILRHPEVADCIPCGRRECLHPVPRICMEAIGVDEVVRRLGGAAGTQESAGETRRLADEPSTSRPGAGSPAEAARDSRRRLALDATLVAVVGAVVLGLLLLASLRGGPWTGREARESEIARETWPSGAGLSPRLNGERIGEFPGAGRIVAAATIRAIGPGGLAPRVPSAAAATVLLVLAYLLARRLGGPSAGLLAASLLVGSVGLIDVGSSAGPDALASCFVLGALLLWLESSRPGARAAPLALAGTAMAASLGFAAGGPVSLAIPAAAIVAERLTERRGMARSTPGTLAAVAALLTAVALSAAWIVAVETADPQPGRGLLSLAMERPPPVGRSGSILPVDILRATVPWTPLAFLALLAHLRVRRYREDLGFADGRWRLSKMGLLAAVVFPGTPPVLGAALLAILVGAWVDHSARRSGLRFRGWLRFVPAALLAFAAAYASLRALGPPDPVERETMEAVGLVGATSGGGSSLVGCGLGDADLALVAFHLHRTIANFRDEASLTAHLATRRPADAVERVPSLLVDPALLPEARRALEARAAAVGSSLAAPLEIRIDGAPRILLGGKESGTVERRPPR